MRRVILAGLLAAGAFIGFGSGFASLLHGHHGHPCGHHQPKAP